MNELSTAIVWACDALESLEYAVRACPDLAAKSSLALAEDEVRRAIEKMKQQITTSN